MSQFQYPAAQDVYMSISREWDVVDDEGNAAWHLAEAGAVEADHGLAHAQQLTRPRQVLEARDGRPRIQRGAIRQAAEGKFEGRVVAQAGSVVGVLVTGGDHEHPQAQDVGHSCG